MELAGVWSEAAPLGGFGVPGELLCSAFNHSSCTPGPERRARPSLLPPHQLSATPARLRAKPGGPAQGVSPRARVRTPPGLLPAVTGYAAPCSGKNPARGRAGAPLQAWIHSQRPRRPPALCRLTGEAPARRACRGEPCAHRPRVAAGLGPPPASPQAARPVRADRRPAVQARARPRVFRFASARRRTVWCRLRARGLPLVGVRGPAGQF